MKIEEIIQNDDQNQICLDEISRLMDCDLDKNSKEGVLLNVLATVVEAYEKKHYPIGEEVNSKSMQRRKAIMAGKSPLDIETENEG